ncbi:hypothetical protein USDA257_c27970 [Sinorhizobium fredii USDA 257]|uniref:Uncharacterized protein n=1 Tax=Sinorhizobium fredii (strain USDA 257) TaxID=1185652 RepID=I3X662_SINF2|nr:hypothetical protein USDA257_c27970 [Sinorhizobium fredii USDA 257]
MLKNEHFHLVSARRADDLNAQVRLHPIANPLQKRVLPQPSVNTGER